MRADLYKAQVQRVLEMVAAEECETADSIKTLNPCDYLDTDLLAREKAMFRRTPLVIGHASEIPESGDFIVREIDNCSWLIVRGRDGVARAFMNYCQHRGTRLKGEEQGNCRHRIVCPYHAWTYDSTGALLGVPRADLFPGLDKSTRSLKQGKLEEAYGLLWLQQDVTADSISVPEFLGGLANEFEERKLGEQYLYFDKTRSLKANWKFPIFAFLESYHLAVLHRESIADFFHENLAFSERFGPHIRSFVPRKNAAALADVDLANTNLAEYVTPTNIIFPNVCMIEHPTSLSLISMWPGASPDTCEWRHMLFTPEEPATDAQRGHYDKTIAVLDEITYEQEDFWVSEQIQEGVNARAIDDIVLSTNEHLLKEFDDLVKASL